MCAPNFFQVDLVDFTNAECGTLKLSEFCWPKQCGTSTKWFTFVVYWMQITNRFTIGKKQGDYWIFHRIMRPISCHLSLSLFCTNYYTSNGTNSISEQMCVGAWDAAGSRSLTPSYSLDIWSSNPFSCSWAYLCLTRPCFLQSSLCTCD